jgi:hypothetical protein
MRWCIPLLNGDNKEETPIAKSASVQSVSTTSTDRDFRSGSDFKSRDAFTSEVSAGSLVRAQYPSFSQRPANLRVFSFPELKTATKNFSQSFMVGEGGFGCVYRGTIRNSEDPATRIEIAVKQLNRKGVQARSFVPFLYCW